MFGVWGHAAAEEIVACRIDDNCVELHCHGGRIAAARIQADLADRGCQIVDWQKLPIFERDHPFCHEALQALALARTERTAAILLDQYHGALVREASRIAANRAKHLARAELQLLIDRFELGRRLTEPFRVVLAGRPNVGKSSLINALVGFQRSIVFDQPGTTRDVVSVATAFEGWPVELSDTAGLGPTDDALEAAGMNRTQERLQRADCIVLVFDASQPYSGADLELVRRYAGALIVHTKADLLHSALSGSTPPDRPVGLMTSATTGQGLDVLATRIAQRLVLNPPAAGAGVPFTQRQLEWLLDQRARLV